MASSSLTNSQVSDLQQKGEFAIKSETVTPKLGEPSLLDTLLMME